MKKSIRIFLAALAVAAGVATFLPKAHAEVPATCGGTLVQIGQIIACTGAVSNCVYPCATPPPSGGGGQSI